MDLMKRFGTFLLANPWRAALVACACGAAPVVGMPLIAWLSYVIVGLVTLRNGAREGFVVFLFAALAPLVYALLFGEYMVFLDEVLGGSFVVYIAALLLRSTSSWSFLIEVALWVCVGLVLMAHMFVPDLAGWWADEISRGFTQIGQYAGRSLEEVRPLVQSEVAVLVPIATGLTLMLGGMFNLIYLGLARWWQAKLFNPVGLKTDLLNIRLSMVTAIGFAVAIFVGKFVFPIGLDVIPVFAGALVVSGLSLIHCYYESRAVKGKGGLIMVYLCMVLPVLSMLAISVIVILAMGDSLFDLRKKFVKKEGS